MSKGPTVRVVFEECDPEVIDILVEQLLAALREYYFVDYSIESDGEVLAQVGLDGTESKLR